MKQPYLKQVHPVLPVKHVLDSVDYYVNMLGFTLAFKDPGDNPNYAGVRRDGIELHMQWHAKEEFKEGLDALLFRVYVDEVDALFEEYKTKDVFHDRTSLKDTPWGTREFGFYDPSGNGLIFYRDLPQ